MSTKISDIAVSITTTLFVVNLDIQIVPQLINSAVTIITGLIMAMLSFFLLRFLRKKFPNEKIIDTRQADGGE